MKLRTVLVTGGCGFIGSHLIRYLLRDAEWRVVNLDKLTYAGDLSRVSDLEGDPRYRFVHGDIADPQLVSELLASERISAIVNCAAESHVDRSIIDPAPFLRTNVVGTQILLDAAVRGKVERFLQVSTDEVYGDVEGLPARTEEDPLHPSSPYAASKAAADMLCLAYRRTYGLPVLIVRSSNNYGPFQHPEKLIPLTIRNLLKGEAVPLYGDGRQQRDWLFVGDCCEALLAVLKRGRPGAVYNVSSGRQIPNVELVRRICALVAEMRGGDADELVRRVMFTQDRPGHDRRYATVAEKVRAETGWVPKVDLQEGLRRTVAWYLENEGWLERAAGDSYREYYEAVYHRGWGKS